MTTAAQEQHQRGERSRVQCLKWAMGTPNHNRIDDECCPDFSCCHPELFETDQAERWATYHKEYGQRS